MEFKTTERAVKDWGGVVACFGYCELQNLLKGVDRNAYTSGVYGWNADIYDFGGVTIVTGYRPFGKRYISAEKYEKQADAVSCDLNLDYDKKMKKIATIRKRFIEKLRAVAVNA